MLLFSTSWTQLHFFERVHLFGRLEDKFVMIRGVEFCFFTSMTRIDEMKWDDSDLRDWLNYYKCFQAGSVIHKTSCFCKISEYFLRWPFRLL